MRNINLRVFISAMCMASVLAGFTTASAAPIRFDQVVQVINARPEKAASTAISQLRIAGDYSFLFGGDDDPKKGSHPQDDRVVTEIRSDIVKDDVCDCEEAEHEHRGFPKWALLGLAAIPIAFIIIHHNETPTPSPTPSIPVTPSMTPTPHTTPSVTPTPMTPPPSPTPPQPTPEPVTILLFGTGLASIGLAARRKYGKKGEKGEK
jgi:hypothetical protein